MGKQPSTASPSPQQRLELDDASLSDTALTATLVAGLLDAAPDGLLMIDAAGIVVLVNSRIEELFGYHRDALLGRPVEVLLPGTLHERHAEHRRHYTDDARVRPMGSGLELRGRRRDGSEFPVDVSLSPLTTRDGQWVVAAIRDDQARHAAERQRREAAVLEEQTRIAEGLADTVIRGLFGTGLALQGALDRPTVHLRAEVERAIEEIDGTISAIRTAIFHLAGRTSGTRSDGPDPGSMAEGTT